MHLPESHIYFLSTYRYSWCLSCFQVKLLFPFTFCFQGIIVSVCYLSVVTTSEYWWLTITKVYFLLFLDMLHFGCRSVGLHMSSSFWDPGWRISPYPGTCFLYLRESSIGIITCGFCLDVTYVVSKTGQVATLGIRGQRSINFLIGCGVTYWEQIYV